MRLAAIVTLSILLGGPLPAASPSVVRAATTVTGLYLDSVPGDGVGRGYPELWGSVSWGSTVQDGTGVTGVAVTAFGPGPWLDLRFDAPAGDHLVAGHTYADGVEAGDCVEPVDSGFTVAEIQPEGIDRKLAIAFWVECNAPEVLFRGDLRVGSAVPFSALVTESLGIDFPDTAVGAESALETISIGSRGNEPLGIASIGLVPDTGDFQVESESCTPSVASGADCEIAVRFTPQGGGLRIADLVIDDDTARGVHVIALQGSSTAPTSGVSWAGTVNKPGPSAAFNRGEALARTVQSDKQRLHLIYGTYKPGGTRATDKGPYAGVYYLRSTTGSTWSDPKRLNGKSYHATRVAVAAAGSRVYVAWASQASVADVVDAPRALYVRVNTRHGAADAWRTTVKLTASAGRIDYPSIAASGSNVVITWTDQVTGDIRVAASHDRGVSWPVRGLSVGTSTAVDESGTWGRPRVALAGSVVAVAWRADAAGSVKVAISNGSGESGTWTAPELIGTDASPVYGSVTIAARGNRIAVAWAARNAASGRFTMLVRQRVDGSWAPTPTMITAFDAEAVSSVGTPVVSLQDPARIAVAWTEERDPGGFIRWAESADGGTSWFAIESAVKPASGRTFNEAASVVWASAGTRYLSWNGGGTPHLYLTRGTGTP